MKEAGEDGPSANPLDADLLDPEHHLFIIDAFEMPSWYYSAERKAFERYVTWSSFSNRINLTKSGLEGLQGSLVWVAHPNLGLI